MEEYPWTKTLSKRNSWESCILVIILLLSVADDESSERFLYMYNKMLFYNHQVILKSTYTCCVWVSNIFIVHF